jgi:HPt (histidine-containing phosphotransfer) domain-containing protein
MNFRELADRLEMKEEEFSEWAKLFVEAGTADLDRLTAAIGKGQWEEAADAAHSIKGAAANLGMAEPYELAGRIEKETRENHVGRTAEWILTLRQILGQLADDLQEGARRRNEQNGPGG